MANDAQGPRLITVKEAAELLRVSPGTVGRLIARCEFGSVRIGSRRFIQPSDIEDYIAYNAEPARPTYTAPVTAPPTAGRRSRQPKPPCEPPPKWPWHPRRATKRADPTRCL